MPPDPNLFAALLCDHLTDTGMHQSRLGELAAELEGRNHPYGQANVSDWANGTRTPNPSQVFAIEAALGLAPGTLSHALGYQPLDAKGPVGVADVIARDPDLTPEQRHLLAAAYRAARTRTRQRRRRT